ncbi:MAG TPA: hypothetical protein VFN83_00285 [Gemmatimonadales bacterium]|nr:hypothetical protein [Gemmatimonadales bacterium]
MQYFHRTSLSPEACIASGARFFGERLSPAEEAPRRRRFTSPLGQLTLTAEAEGGHYTRVQVSTDQPGESELDKLGKRFLTLLHAEADPSHRPVGAY